MQKKAVKKKDLAEDLTKQQLIELDACVGCGECLKWCGRGVFPGALVKDEDMVFGKRYW